VCGGGYVFASGQKRLHFSDSAANHNSFEIMPLIHFLVLLCGVLGTIQANESVEPSSEVTVNTVSSAEGECAHRADDNDRKLVS